ncbi:hypothetical protein ACWJIK_01260 [Corynebacterium minutissimum]
MTNSIPTQKPKKPWWKKWWVILIAVLLVIGLIGSLLDGSETAEETKESPETTSVNSPEEEETAPEHPTVKHAGQEWECLPVPDDTMSRIMDGDLWDDGAHATVEKAVMVQGADNNFVATSILWEGEDEPFAADFTTAVDGGGPITSASSGTAELFNWPETPGGPFDGTGAAQECLKK